MRNFLAYPFAPYKGLLSARPFNDGKGRPKGQLVGLKIKWSDYTANGAALGAANPNYTINLNMGSVGPNVAGVNWFIQSLYIDNEGVDFPVYVSFPDTFFTVTCPPNSAGWFPVITNSRVALVSAVGISDAAITAQQTTGVFFTDALFEPSLDPELPQNIALYKASATASRGNSPQTLNWGAPALGDQFSQVTASINQQVGVTVVSGDDNNFIYINSISVDLWGASNSTAGVETVGFNLSSINPIGTLLTLGAVIPGNNVPGNGTFNVFRMEGLNWKLSIPSAANLTFSISGFANASGTASCCIAYTKNPF